MSIIQHFTPRISYKAPSKSNPSTLVPKLQCCLQLSYGVIMFLNAILPWITRNRPSTMPPEWAKPPNRWVSTTSWTSRRAPPVAAAKAAARRVSDSDRRPRVSAPGGARQLWCGDPQQIAKTLHEIEKLSTKIQVFSSPNCFALIHLVSSKLTDFTCMHVIYIVCWLKLLVFVSFIYSFTS